MLNKVVSVVIGRYLQVDLIKFEISEKVQLHAWTSIGIKLESFLQTFLLIFI